MIDPKTIDRARMDELKRISSRGVTNVDDAGYASELEKLCAIANTFIGYMLEELDQELKQREAAKRRQQGLDKVLDKAHGREAPRS